jgi:hypothetical protein
VLFLNWPKLWSFGLCEALNFAVRSHLREVRGQDIKLFVLFNSFIITLVLHHCFDHFLRSFITKNCRIQLLSAVFAKSMLWDRLYISRCWEILLTKGLTSWLLEF